MVLAGDPVFFVSHKKIRIKNNDQFALRILQGVICLSTCLHSRQTGFRAVRL